MQTAILIMGMMRPQPHVLPPPINVKHPNASRGGARIYVDEEVYGTHVYTKGGGRSVDGERPARFEPDRMVRKSLQKR